MGSQVVPDGAAGPVRVAVTVLSGDVGWAREVLRTLAGHDPDVLTPAERRDADIVVVLADQVTDAVAEEMAGWEYTGQRIVLVAGLLRERFLPRLFGAGVVSVLRYGDVTALQVVRAVLASTEGRAVVPDQLARWLVDEVRAAQSGVLMPQGVLFSGLAEREVEVIRRLADGYDTMRIAEELNYSERTIKKIIQDVLTRLQLRNRAHAVSYAMRVGAI
ncbi:LuxR C-terminal-related transcriptional regulator [Lentzea sp. NPDC058450]|uniref:helix-turn-helix transcriptional regulator n=1 Tax=Lentzea sp. NPDC058450 TaxID=3346505 RepID=UPI0036531A50